MRMHYEHTMDKITGMQPNGSDPRVRKTFVRHSEQRLSSPDRRSCITAKKSSTSDSGSKAGLIPGHAVGFKSVRKTIGRISSRGGTSTSISTVQPSEDAVKRRAGKALEQPTLCSSLALHNLINQLKISQPDPLGTEDIRDNANVINKKVTKQLNFPFHGTIYKNLVGLNPSEPTTCHTSEVPRRLRRRRDLEPKEEDYLLVEEVDDPPFQLYATWFRSKAFVIKGDV